MWLLVFIFLAFTLLVGWMLFGYFIFLYWNGFCRRTKEPQIPESLPSVSIAVPCYNEERDIMIATALSYPFYRQSSLYSRLQENGREAEKKTPLGFKKET